MRGNRRRRAHGVAGIPRRFSDGIDDLRRGARLVLRQVDERRRPRFALVAARDGRYRRVFHTVQRHLVFRRRAARVQREYHARACGRRRAPVCVLPCLIRVDRDILVVLPLQGDDA